MPGIRGPHPLQAERGTGTRNAGLILTVLLAGLTLVACERPASTADDVTVEWTMMPAVPLVDRAATVAFTLRDASDRPLEGASLDVEAHMEHPGMAPVIVHAEARGGGVYGARLSATMAGDWVVFVTGTLPDGRRLRHRAAAFAARTVD